MNCMEGGKKTARIVRFRGVSGFVSLDARRKPLKPQKPPGGNWFVDRKKGPRVQKKVITPEKIAIAIRGTPRFWGDVYAECRKRPQRCSIFIGYSLRPYFLCVLPF